MGNPITSSSSTSSSSYSYSSSSSSSTATNTQGSRSFQSSSTDPSGNTTTHSAHQNLGEAPVTETRTYDSSGRELIQDTASGLAGGARITNQGEGGPVIEDVTEQTGQQAANDKLYEERMEEEYAKREGGA